MKREWYIFGALVVLNLFLVYAVIVGGRSPAPRTSGVASGAPSSAPATDASNMSGLDPKKFNPRHSAAMMPLIGYAAVTPKMLGRLKAALARAPGDADYHAVLGSALLATGQFDEATTTLEEARKIDAQCSLALCFQGDLALTKNDVSGALSSYEKAVTGAKRGFDRALALRRVGLVKMWRNDLDAAAAALEQAQKAASTEQPPDAVLLRVLLLTDQSDLALVRGDRPKALSLLEEAARLADSVIPTDEKPRLVAFDDRPVLRRIASLAWLRVARCASDNGDFARALAVIGERVKVDGEAFTVADLRVSILLANGKAREAQILAIPLYARRLSPDNVVTIFRKLGVAPPAPAASAAPVAAASASAGASAAPASTPSAAQTPGPATPAPPTMPGGPDDESFQSYSETQAKVTRFMMSEQYDIGIRYCERILEVEPMRAQVRGLMAMLLEARGNLEEAQKQALQANSVIETPAAMHTLGMLELRKGDLQKAAEMFQKEITVGEASSGDMIQGGVTALAYTRLWMAGPQEAADELKKHTSETAQGMGAYLNLQAAIDLLQGRNDAAVEKARRLVTLKPDDMMAGILLANVLEVAGRPQEALAALDNVSAPTDPSSIQRLLLARLHLLVQLPQTPTAISEATLAQILYPGGALSGVDLWKARYAARK